MDADRFIAFYGLRFEVPNDDEAIQLLELDTHPWLVAAKRGSLASHFGRASDGEPYFVFVGRSLGHFGYEDAVHHSLSDAELAEIARESRQKLSDAGFTEVPRLSLQFQGQH